MFDSAILPRCVECLKDQQQPPLILRIEHVLKLSQHLDAGRQSLFSSRFVLIFKIERIGGINVLQAELAAVGNAERACESAGGFDEFFVFHEFWPDFHSNATRSSDFSERLLM